MAFFQVLGAQAINPFTVVVTFSEAPDLSIPATTNPANYGFTGGLSAVRILAGPTANSVKVVTTGHSYALYTVTVQGTVQSVLASTIDPGANSAGFTGFTSSPKFSVSVQSSTVLTLLFKQTMLANGDLTNPASYTLQAVSGGAPLAILSVTKNVPANPTHLTLKLSAPLPSGIPLTLSLSTGVRTSDGRLVQPNNAVLFWQKRQNRVSVPLAKFTGEVRAPRGLRLDLQETLQLEESFASVLDPISFSDPRFPETFPEVLALVEYLTVQGSGSPAKQYGVSISETLLTNVRTSTTSQPEIRSTRTIALGESLFFQESLSILPELPSGLAPEIAKLFGKPDGLVFFSPSLKPGGAPTSSLQVDDVKACTQAYDVYQFPQPIDPKPLYTHGGGLTATPEVTTLNNGVLFVEFYRLKEAKHKLRDRKDESVLPPVDAGATFTFTEQTYPPNRVALLSNPGWKLFDNTAPPPYRFVTADNLNPIPVGSVTYRRHFQNPAEVLQVTEQLSVILATSLGVADTLIQAEDFDLVPGEQVVQVNLTEVLGVSESLLTKVGVNLSESLTLSEGISVAV